MERKLTDTDGRRFSQGTLGYRHLWWKARLPKAVLVSNDSYRELSWQCYCGGLTVYKYRAHYYCGSCGRRIKHPENFVRVGEHHAGNDLDSP